MDQRMIWTFVLAPNGTLARAAEGGTGEVKDVAKVPELLRSLLGEQ